MELDTGATAWVLTSSALVLLMTTPALALFYGGMTRSKSVLNMMLMSYVSVGIVGVIYVLWGFGMSFGSTTAGGLFGNVGEYFGLNSILPTADVTPMWGETGIPTIVFVGFQFTFAAITVALVSGAIADRVKFAAWVIFAAVWVSLVYFPLAHQVWGGGILSGAPGGVFDPENGLFKGLVTVGETVMAPIDFAGGTVVHINAGVAGLVLALIIGKRVGWGKESMRPHNLPLVMIGAGLLWFGWFGFNAGSALAADGLAGLAWVNTAAATAAAMLAWLLVEKLRFGSSTSLGAASGIVAGLVAITPAAGALTPVTSIILGLVAGTACAFAISLTNKLGFDDSLDVVGVHLVGGLVGTLLVGLLATDTGLFSGHGINQFIIQLIVALAAMIFSALVTAIVGLAIKYTIGWRVTRDDEVQGIDVTQHAETAYEGVSA